MDELAIYKDKYQRLFPHLPERARRLVVAADAKARGRGGITFVQRASGISRVTIARGVRELGAGSTLPPERSRRAGGGRKRLTVRDPTVQADLLRVVADATRGDPESPLRWTTKSTRIVAKELAAQAHAISHTKVGQLLKEADYSLQANAKTHEGADHPDRDAQFQYLNTTVKAYLAAGDPVISVDTKKKELVGNFKNPGQTWLPKGQPVEVNLHDFPDRERGRAVPYGIYDLAQDQGYVNVGIDHDTAEFAVASIRRWWQHLGQARYPRATRFLMTADAGGSNGYRLRLWKKELQTLADDTGLKITVCHMPPGTSKWNKIEHRLFSFISLNWKGRPLTSYQVIVHLIASTTTQTGLKVYAMLDDRTYAPSKKVTDEEMSTICLQPHEFHGEWNYTIKPRPQ